MEQVLGQQQVSVNSRATARKQGAELNSKTPHPPITYILNRGQPSFSLDLTPQDLEI